jgi:hypothetical protein
MIMVRIGDPKRAIVAFRRALDVNPGLDDIRATVEALEKQVSEDL